MGSKLGNKVARKRVLILVENLPSPFDRRVWQEATTLESNGYEVSIICPTGKGFDKADESIDGVRIYRYRLPIEGVGPWGYLREYSSALFHTLRLALKVHFTHGFDVIHACNPPDLFFLIGGFFKIFFRKRFLYDHHDICPELYFAKYGRQDLFYRLMLLFEYCSFKTADVSIATNESYRKIAIERGGMDPQRVFIVRSGPMLDRLRSVPAKEELKRGCRYMVGYVGVMGIQEGINLLLDAARYIIHDAGRKDVHFVLVGSGTSLDSLKKMSIDLDISRSVTFTGRVSDKELVEVLSTADVCVNPDVANEMNDKSTMNKIMEYMALGKPIVQFDLIEGRISAQESSLYAKKNDPVDMAIKILDLLNDPQQRKWRGEFGRRRIQTELEWRHEIPNLLSAYSKIFSSGSAESG